MLVSKITRKTRGNNNRTKAAFTQHSAKQKNNIITETEREAEQKGDKNTKKKRAQTPGDASLSGSGVVCGRVSVCVCVGGRKKKREEKKE
jgi:hypothetical protein